MKRYEKQKNEQKRGKMIGFYKLDGFCIKAQAQLFWLNNCWWLDVFFLVLKCFFGQGRYKGKK